MSPIGPVCAPAGTVILSWVAETERERRPGMPSKVAAVTLERLVPLTVTSVPTGPAAGVKFAIVGGRMTVKLGTLVPVPAGVVTESLFGERGRGHGDGDVRVVVDGEDGRDDGPELDRGRAGEGRARRSRPGSRAGPAAA